MTNTSTNENTQTSSEQTIQYIEEVKPTSLSAEQLFEKLCNLHREINMLTEDAKQIMQDNKESLDTTLINNIAKAYVKDKIGDMEGKMQDTLTMIGNLVK